MNSAELRQLAEDRLADAQALLAAGRWSGAYYLAGYAVECALKACIVKRLMATDEFPEKRYSEQCWTHNLTLLVSLAGLKNTLDLDLAAQRRFEDNWTLVRDWLESSRYLQTSQLKAQAFLDAIADPTNGVLAWIQRHW